MITIIKAHPYPDRSRANRALSEATAGLEGVDVRSLYELYPDFSIDVEAEREALQAATTIVWQHPLYWYTAPALLKLWFEKVLGSGWAYGTGGRALHGKQCLWVVTSGGDERDYHATGMHQHSFEAFLPVMKQTAQFCGMDWLPPLIVHGAHRIERSRLTAHGREYRERLLELLTKDLGAHA